VSLNQPIFEQQILCGLVRCLVIETSFLTINIFVFIDTIQKYHNIFILFTKNYNHMKDRPSTSSPPAMVAKTHVFITAAATAIVLVL
jgi:hypothetical protein